MVSSKAATVEEYLAELPENRRDDIQQVREVILANLPDGFQECMQYGMIGYAIPLERFPDTYNKQALGVAALAAQKRHISVYLHGLYADPELTEWLWRPTSKRASGSTWASPASAFPGPRPRRWT